MVVARTGRRHPTPCSVAATAPLLRARAAPATPAAPSSVAATAPTASCSRGADDPNCSVLGGSDLPPADTCSRGAELSCCFVLARRRPPLLLRASAFPARVAATTSPARATATTSPARATAGSLAAACAAATASPAPFGGHSRLHGGGRPLWKPTREGIRG
jgi:hypothetical protein